MRKLPAYVFAWPCSCQLCRCWHPGFLVHVHGLANAAKTVRSPFVGRSSRPSPLTKRPQVTASCAHPVHCGVSLHLYSTPGQVPAGLTPSPTERQGHLHQRAGCNSHGRSKTTEPREQSRPLTHPGNHTCHEHATVRAASTREHQMPQYPGNERGH